MADRSQFMAEVINKKIEDSSYVDGMLIGLDALPDTKSLAFRARMMPLEDPALLALDGAWRKWSSHWGERTTLAAHTDRVFAVAFSPDGKRALTGSFDNTARLWSVFSAQDMVDEVKATVPRCMTPDEREHSHLHNAAPRWCHARNLWPYIDHGPPKNPGSSPPYGPPALTWDEKLFETWDRWTS